MVRFQFPLEWLQPGPGEVVQERDFESVAYRIPPDAVLRSRENDVVAYEEDEEAALLIIDFVQVEQKRITGRALTPMGPGPWSTRRWQVDLRNDRPVKTVVDFGAVLCQVELDGNKLTPGSIGSMEKSAILV